MSHCSLSMLLKSTSFCFTKWSSEMAPVSLSDQRSLICWMYVEHRLAILEGVWLPPGSASFSLEYWSPRGHFKATVPSRVNCFCPDAILHWIIPSIMLFFQLINKIINPFKFLFLPRFFLLLFWSSSLLFLWCFLVRIIRYEHSSVTGTLWACRWGGGGHQG